MDIKRSAFVVMPFSTSTSALEVDWTEIYDDIFKAAFTEIGYNCERAKPETGNLIQSIITKLRNARIVLADLTDKNPNVFYELGVRHALSKRTILVAQDSKFIPSDLRGYWWLIYGTKPGQVRSFKQAIKSIVGDIEKNPDKSDSPVSDFLKFEISGTFDVATKANLKKLSALVTELSALKNTLDESINARRRLAFVYYECVNILLDTHYVDVGERMFTIYYDLRLRLRALQIGNRVSSRFIAETRDTVMLLICETDKIMQQLQAGDIAESDIVSTMFWKLVENAERQNLNIYSQAVGKTPGVLDSIKKDLKKRGKIK